MYDIVVDGIAADLPLTDADPIHLDIVHKTMIKALLGQVQNANAPCGTSKIRNLYALMKADSNTITCAYQFYSGALPLHSFLPDPKRDSFTDNTLWPYGG